MTLASKEEKLAVEIATALNDMDSIQLHRKYVMTYSEAHLRKCMMKALKVREESVRVSRGALYNSLVRGYGSHARD
jgi:hypothetical protein